MKCASEWLKQFASDNRHMHGSILVYTGSKKSIRLKYKKNMIFGWSYTFFTTCMFRTSFLHSYRLHQNICRKVVKLWCRGGIYMLDSYHIFGLSWNSQMKQNSRNINVIKDLINENDECWNEISHSHRSETIVCLVAEWQKALHSRTMTNSSGNPIE